MSTEDFIPLEYRTHVYGGFVTKILFWLQVAAMRAVEQNMAAVRD